MSYSLLLVSPRVARHRDYLKNSGKHSRLRPFWSDTFSNFSFQRLWNKKQKILCVCAIHTLIGSSCFQMANDMETKLFTGMIKQWGKICIPTSHRQSEATLKFDIYGAKRLNVCSFDNACFPRAAGLCNIAETGRFCVCEFIAACALEDETETWQDAKASSRHSNSYRT